MTSIALSEDDAILAAADDDNCVSVMRLGEKSDVAPVVQRVLRGHDGCVTCIAVASRMNLVATASEDGSGLPVYHWSRVVILWALRDGAYLRSLYHEKEDGTPLPVDWCAVTEAGNVLTYSKASYTMTVFDLAGAVIARHEFIHQLTAVTMDASGKNVIAGTERGDLFILRAYDLEVITTGPTGFAEAPKLASGVAYLMAARGLCVISDEKGSLLLAGK